MSQTLSLTVPDTLGDRLKRIAAVSRRPLEEVLLSALDAAVPTSFFGRVFGRTLQETLLERQLRLEMQHAERLRALEMGSSLPEVEMQRLATQRKLSDNHTTILVLFSLLMLLVPAALCGIATGASSVVLSQGGPDTERLYLAIVWLAASLMIAACEAALVAFGLAVLRPYLMASWSRADQSESTACPPAKK